MKFVVIGIDDSPSPSFSEKVMMIIAQGRVFSGGTRHYEIVKNILPSDHRWIAITPPMTTLFERYEEYDELVVFASGDPLFYGFASTVITYMPDAELEVYPYFNSLQLLAHKSLIPYHDMRVVSLTGRSWARFDQSLISGESLIGILTDNKEHTPSKIAVRMIEYGYTNYTMIVGELLGNDKEQINFVDLQQAANKKFKYPNNIILRRETRRARPFGIADEEFALLDGRKKMITKKAIRLASLSELDLRDRGVFWDIGFCTGSISIEAKLQFPHLEIHSFEVREECEQVIDSNIKKFGAIGVNWHIGDFVDFPIDNLPAPNAIFIGGHGGKLAEIVEKCARVMTDNAVLVFNSVSESSQELFLSSIAQCGLSVENSYQIKTENNNTITIIKSGK